MQFQITVSYSQLCVFDAALEAPYNDWREGHTAQGFAWRPGSVSFATEDVQTPVEVDVSRWETPPETNDTSYAIRVPFEVPASGKIEVGSIMSGTLIELRPGSYALYFLAPKAVAEPFRLIFVPAGNVDPSVLGEGPHAKRQPSYLMEAEAA